MNHRVYDSRHFVFPGTVYFGLELSLLYTYIPTETTFELNIYMTGPFSGMLSLIREFWLRYRAGLWF